MKEDSIAVHFLFTKKVSSNQFFVHIIGPKITLSMPYDSNKFSSEYAIFEL